MTETATTLSHIKDALAVIWGSLAPWAKPLYPLAVLLVVMIVGSAYLLLGLSHATAREEWRL